MRGNNTVISILSFSEIYRDSRVKSQLEALTGTFNCHAIGWGDAPGLSHNAGTFVWHTISPRSQRSKFVQCCFFVVLVLGGFIPAAFDYFFWRRKWRRDARKILLRISDLELIWANDWEALVVAMEVKRMRPLIKVIFDSHEYPTEEFPGKVFRLIIAPMIAYYLRRYSGSVDASVTISPVFAQRFEEEYNLKPVVIYNVSSNSLKALVDSDEVPLSGSGRLMLVHHGVRNRDRCLEKMIEAVCLCSDRFELHFFLTGGDEDYERELREFSGDNNSVFFHDSMDQADIVEGLKAFSIGMYILEPSCYNNKYAMPNKIFEFIAAGIGVVIAPSPSMVELISEYGCGEVASGFEADDMAMLLRGLTLQRISQLRRNARKAALVLTPDVQRRAMKRLVSDVLGLEGNI
jgi:glycosyltransferase involved in cell wall biosynthesis